MKIKVIVLLCVIHAMINAFKILTLRLKMSSD